MRYLITLTLAVTSLYAATGATRDTPDIDKLITDFQLQEMTTPIRDVPGAAGKNWARVALVTVENLRRYVAGEPLLNVVAMQAGY